MLIDREVVLVNQLQFSLTYDDGTVKAITVKTDDIISCTYLDRDNTTKKVTVKGKVKKIKCNFNSSLGRVGTDAYMVVDCSDDYDGLVVSIRPSQVLALTTITTSSTITDVVCSVDNATQKVSLIRENEAGVFQYSLDGITWKDAGGASGLSAYEIAVKEGYTGTEKEWIASLQATGNDPSVAVQYTAPTDDAVKVWIKNNTTASGKIIPFISDTTVTTEDTWSSSKIVAAIAAAIAANRANKWFTGTLITGTSTTPTIFSNSTLTASIAGDMYLNTSTSNVYQCIVGGDAATATWSYQCNLKTTT